MASLPDLIFTVLFFFMIVTHMRDVEKQVSYQLPSGTEVEKVGHQKNRRLHLYRPAHRRLVDNYQIQLNNR